MQSLLKILPFHFPTSYLEMDFRVGEISMNDGRISWTIPWYRVPVSNICIISPEFRCPKGSRWGLSLVKGAFGKSVIISLLKLSSLGPDNVLLRVQLDVTARGDNNSETALYSNTAPIYVTSYYDESFRFVCADQIVVMCELIEPSSPRYLINNLRAGIEDGGSGEEIATPKSAAKLRGDLKNLLLSGKGRDVVLKVEDKEFKAHRSILGIRSPVFSNMFEHDTDERSSGVVDIKGCDSDTFSAFLHYIYTGSTENLSLEMAMSLYRIADKYQVPELKEDCLERMEARLTAENFCDVLSFSLHCQEPNLKKAATEFFLSKAADVVRTPKWEEFLSEHPEAANALYLKLIVDGPSTGGECSKKKDNKGAGKEEGGSDEEIATPKSAAKLRGDLKNLLLSGKDSDVVLKVEDKEFKAHRSILEIRSPVFSTMFEHDTVERSSGVVDIKDCKSDTFSAFLHYIYTGSIENFTSKLVISLYRIADKYQVPELKEDCLGRMEAILTGKNVYNLFSFSRHRQEPNLKEANSFESFLSKVVDIFKTLMFLCENPVEAKALYLKLAIDGPSAQGNL